MSRSRSCALVLHQFLLKQLLTLVFVLWWLRVVRGTMRVILRVLYHMRLYRFLLLRCCPLFKVWKKHSSSKVGSIGTIIILLCTLNRLVCVSITPELLYVLEVWTSRVIIVFIRSGLGRETAPSTVIARSPLPGNSRVVIIVWIHLNIWIQHWNYIFTT